MCDKCVIGISISEKKRQKINWSDFRKIADSEGFTLKPININQNLESQGPLDVFLCKLSDTSVSAARGDQNARAAISRIQQYINKHPELVVVDPLENVRNLYIRQTSYKIIQEELQLNGVFVPNFVELKSKNVAENVSLLKNSNVTYPFLCKPLIAEGTSDAHKIMIIFNEKDLKDCQPPCVAQHFINHNAILYKLFIVGENFHVVERPSLKNFYQEDCKSLSTIFFSSHDISKSRSTSKWSILSEEDIPLTVKPNHELLEKIVRRIIQIFGLTLVGVDIIIENHTGKYAIIDINVFPGYDGYPNFYQHLINSIKCLLAERKVYSPITKSCTLKKCLSDDLDSGFESDEKKKYSPKKIS